MVKTKEGAKVNPKYTGFGELWEDYWTGRAKGDGLDARNKIAESNFPLVKFVAEKIYSKIPSQSQVDFGDLYDAGIFGLIHGIEKYDPDNHSGVKPSTYLSAKIRFAILDELRRIDLVPRTIRAKEKKLSRAKLKLKTGLGYEPNDEELRRYMKIPVKEFERIKKGARITEVMNFDSLNRKPRRGGLEKSAEFGDLLKNKKTQTPHQIVDYKDLEEFVLKGLSATEISILSLYHVEEMTQKEIGEFMGVSGSRVQQICPVILDKLKKRLMKAG